MLMLFCLNLWIFRIVDIRAILTFICLWFNFFFYIFRNFSFVILSIIRFCTFAGLLINAHLAVFLLRFLIRLLLIFFSLLFFLITFAILIDFFIWRLLIFFLWRFVLPAAQSMFSRGVIRRVLPSQSASSISSSSSTLASRCYSTSCVGCRRTSCLLNLCIFSIFLICFGLKTDSLFVALASLLILSTMDFVVESIWSSGWFKLIELCDITYQFGN